MKIPKETTPGTPMAPLVFHSLKKFCECGGSHPQAKHDLVLLADAKQREDLALDEAIRKNHGPCRVCHGGHATYYCCDDCNHVNHRCHFCGDDIGHGKVSACYIIEGDERAHPEEWQ